MTAALKLIPDDDHNRELVEHAHPATWVNPTPAERYNLVVIGGGTAGLVSAAGAAGLGAKVALIERHLLGGDCLNYGCVPSKALIRAARVAHDVRGAGAFGVSVGGAPAIDFGRVTERVRSLRASISHHDAAARFRQLGVDVYLGDAHFAGPTAVEVDGRRLEFARAVIATGARAASLEVPGLEGAGFLTNETVFQLTSLPRRLVVVGAGPIGCELAQAFCRLGARVSVLSQDTHVLPREDADAAAIVQARLVHEGVTLHLGAKLTRVERRDGAKVVTFEAQGGVAAEVVGDEILVAVGRAANVEGLALDAAGVAFDKKGVSVDDRLRTTNPRVYAAGDICSRFQFTHAADAMARVVLQNALFFGRKRASALNIPWCTFTDPEIAHVGLYEAQARERFGDDVRTFTVPMGEVDRAVLDGDTEGLARVHADRKGRILGATLVSAHAGESINEMTLAMNAGVRLGSFAGTIHPYPTQADALRRLGDLYQRSRLTPGVKRFLGWLLARRR